MVEILRDVFALKRPSHFGDEILVIPRPPRQFHVLDGFALGLARLSLAKTEIDLPIIGEKLAAESTEGRDERRAVTTFIKV